ncbi:MAG TPA: hypothetical protein VFW90_00195 [Candidatus Saccharimonadales bacterium]|nr:hypothetical protein [Candidatus Saccharimonadales bacterium]
MKRKDIALLVGVAFFTAVFAYFLTSLIFKVPARTTQVPVAGQITTTFPDIRHDPQYNTIFNSSALDPAVPLQVGGQNNQPFNGTSQ